MELREKMVYVVGVTGHRKLLGKKDLVFQETKKCLEGVLKEHPGESIEVNTGMALGFDQLVCEVCLEIGIPYVAAVPYEGQEGLWNPLQKGKYQELIQKASRVVVVNPGPYEIWKLHARNGWIVKNSQEMVVHWNGVYEGGTGACMRLVNQKKLPWKNTFKPSLDNPK